MSHPPSRRQTHLFWTALSGLSIAILVGLIVLLVWGLGRVLDILSPVLWPLAVAGVVAYLLDPVVDFIERKGVSRSRAIVCVFAVAIIIVAGVSASVIPAIVNQTREFAARVPAIQDKTIKFVEDWINNPNGLYERLKGSSGKTPAASAPVVTTN